MCVRFFRGKIWFSAKIIMSHQNATKRYIFALIYFFLILLSVDLDFFAIKKKQQTNEWAESRRESIRISVIPIVLKFRANLQKNLKMRVFCILTKFYWNSSYENALKYIYKNNLFNKIIFYFIKKNKRHRNIKLQP